jgi:hypothetical protein
MRYKFKSITCDSTQVGTVVESYAKTGGWEFVSMAASGNEQRRDAVVLLFRALDIPA